jgi:hypothetical protein
MKPDCYSCKWRRNIPGDAHSSCAHPKLGEMDSNPFAALFDVLSNPRKIIAAASELQIAGDEHGMRMGWFMWPVNFDPVWLKSCNGHEERQ